MAQSANTDTLFRAAYCLGVIEVYFPTEEKMIGARFDTCDVQWRDWGFDSSTMCKLGMGVTYNGSKQDGATRYRRYWQYLQFAGPKIGTAEYSELAQVTGKGRANTQEIASQRPDGLDGLVPESCRQQCPEPTKDLASMINNIEACSLPCTEQLDPVRANILRWVSLSDHLPF